MPANRRSARRRPEPLSGRAGKDAAMVKMRELANRGGFTNWGHVLTAYEALHGCAVALRLWAGASDIAEIDMICERWRRSNSSNKRRQKKPA